MGRSLEDPRTRRAVAVVLAALVVGTIVLVWI
jgi:hypothetical protein